MTTLLNAPAARFPAPRYLSPDRTWDTDAGGYVGSWDWACRQDRPPLAETGPLAITEQVVDEAAADRDRLYGMIGGSPRHVTPGTYLTLTERGRLWMSDTRDEIRDHYPAALAAREAHAGTGARTALINGLGLGMVVRGLAATVPTMQRIDVVERNADVVALVAPALVESSRRHGVEVVVHTADAYAIQWPPGTRWDIAWHDIWPTITSDNLAGMSRLHRRYGRRTDWQGSWCRAECERARAAEARWRW